jgi:predicted  nucleic acid-binding Zn-ribbon protein
VETDVQKGVDLSNNSKVTSVSDESLVSAQELQGMLATFMTAMQAENVKLASNLESKLNKLSDDLDVKLASVSESLSTKLNSVSDRLDAKINLMIANVTSEMRRENVQIMQEFSMQLHTEVQLITKEVDVVRNRIDTELTNCVKRFESECNKLNKNVNDYKSQNDASMNGLRSVVNKNREKLENKIDELTHEVRTVTSSLDECHSSIQMNKRNYQLEIQRLDFQIENLRAKFKVNVTNQTGSAICASPQTSSTIRVIDVGRPTSEAAPDISESGNCSPPVANGVSANEISRCNEVRNVNTVAGSGIESVGALSETYVDSSHYNELLLPKFTDSSQQAAVHFVRELDE